MPSRSFKFIVIPAVLALAACGEGWEMQRIDNIVPYGNTRTAGTGVAYVRAKMLPEKTLNTAVPVEQKLKSAEPVFDKQQKK